MRVAKVEVEAYKLKQFLNAASKVNDSINIILNEDDGLKAQVIDDGLVFGVDLISDYSNFELFRTNNPEMTVNLDLDMLAKIFKRAKKPKKRKNYYYDPADYTTVYFTEEKTYITFDGNGVRTMFTVINDKPKDTINIPDLDHEIKFEIVAKTFKEILKDFDKYTESVTFEFDGKNETLKIIGRKRLSDEENTEIVLNGYENLYFYRITDTVNHYAYHWLKIISNFMDLAKKDVVISLTQDQPMKIEIETDIGIINLYLAPRIED